MFRNPLKRGDHDRMLSFVYELNSKILLKLLGTTKQYLKLTSVLQLSYSLLQKRIATTHTQDQTQASSGSGSRREFPLTLSDPPRYQPL